MREYAVYLGGRLWGDPPGFLHADRVPLDEIVPLTTRRFERFKQDRRRGPTLGDFCHRAARRPGPSMTF